ncbi:transcriptional regulator, CarD family [Acetitomaculum ruminis DSM 5522]|uniref:Transcriptional regulator, CarD family n=1 Tax=Acetitomaculum ruminis DSM 5522 TaxID=1120918 RepID=A0A1I1AD39_9FIRM|nr:CarD family transcriptional regulator [Acetitomaculum ruminis]SFB34390.1 transcriptional regulator, CarD family [Acetitomaculum ruminis DSM 5522]
MFKIGEYVIYGTKGVCRVKDIAILDFKEISEDGIFYVLEPVNIKNNQIYVPVNQDKVVLRKILSKKEALSIIDSVPDLEQVEIPDEKNREVKYKEVMETGDCKNLFRMIKTMNARQQKRMAEGRKITIVDDRYLKAAKENLYGEFSIIFHKDKSEMEKLITDRIEETKDSHYQ